MSIVCSSTAKDACSSDLYFNGQVVIKQPLDGYRSNLDTVLLSASIESNARGRLLDLGCGVGTAFLLAAYRSPELSVVGLDCFEACVSLAQDNIGVNAMQSRAHAVYGDVLNMRWARSEVVLKGCAGGDVLAEGTFDYVIMNPPYFIDKTTCLPSSLYKRQAFFAKEGDMHVWSKVAYQALKHKGTLYVIQSASRLAEVVASMAPLFGGVTLLPLQSKEGGEVKRFLIKARKNTKEPSKVLSSFVLHHEGGYTQKMDKILSGEEYLSF